MPAEKTCAVWFTALLICRSFLAAKQVNATAVALLTLKVTTACFLRCWIVVLEYTHLLLGRNLNVIFSNNNMFKNKHWLR